VVDDAIVMIENIARYIEAGERPLAAALKGAGEIGFTILSLTVSLVPVLIPLLFMADVVFDGGLRRAQTEQARAAYQQSVASYRQTVLTAFQEVEDNVAALRILERETLAQDAAVRAALDVVTLVTNQYRAGTVSYLEVAVAQATALERHRSEDRGPLAGLTTGWTFGKVRASPFAHITRQPFPSSEEDS
jgi:hypothetical protein